MSGGPTAVLIGGTDPFVRLGGHETLVVAHAEAAVRAGFDTHVFYVTAREPPAVARRWTAHPVRSPVRPLRTLMAGVHAPFLARAVERFVAATSGPLVIHAFAGWACVAATVARRFARRGRRITTVASAYTTLAHEFHSKLASISPEHGAGPWLSCAVEVLWGHVYASRVERRGYAAMRFVLVNYASVRALLDREFALDVPVRRVPYAPLSAFSATDATAPPEIVDGLTPAGAPLVVAVSRHDPRKGIDRLIRALGMLHADRVPFRACIVGGGPLLAAHRALATRLGLDACTALPGRVGDALAYLRAADVFALPSLEEGSGSLSLLEAMQAGCAPVVTNVDGLPEDVTDGDNGLLVAAGDPAALRDALARLLADAPLRARLSAAARTTFERRFSADVLVSTVRELYSELAGAR